jgi:lipopolysaccharide biosynthesis glycosyltransferase
VAFICDSYYVIPTAVAITSLICNKNPDTYYNIYVIAANLSEMEIEKFYEFKGSNADIHIIKASLKKLEGIPKFLHITSTSCLKFELPNLIPHQDKVLYLDSDVIIQKDLSELFETNINDFYAGVIKDIGLIDNDLNIKNYFNSGIMLLNLKLMRENDASAALFNIRRSVDNLTYVDQDCFNILFEKKVKLLPIIYNCFYNFFLKHKDKYSLDYINKFFETNYLSLDDIKKDSCIIHLVSYDKPWVYFNNYFISEWNEYFKKSPFRLHKLKRKSINLREFIESHNVINVLYYFFQFWQDNGFKYAMGKAKNYFIKK